MNLFLSDEQDAMQRALGLFLSNRLVRPDRDESATVIDDQFWGNLMADGWLSVSVAAAAGGGDGSVVDEIVVHREFGRHLAPGPTIGTSLATNLLHAADDKRLLDVLEGRMRVGLVVQAQSPDRHTGLDVDSSGLAVRIDDGIARLVEVDVGLAEPYQCIDHSVRACAVPSSAIDTSAGTEGMWPRAACLVAAQLAGIAEATLSLSTTYAQDRFQFGVPIGSFQAVKHRCADMAVRAEEAWSLTCLAALLTEEGDPTCVEVAACALVAALEAASENSWHNIQNHGGIGFTTEVSAHRFLKRTHVLGSMIGGARAQFDTIVRVPLSA